MVCSTASIYDGAWCQGACGVDQSDSACGFCVQAPAWIFSPPPVRAWRLGQELQTELQISCWGFFGQEYPLREKEALDGPKVNFENVASVFPSNEPSVYQSNLT